VRICDGDYIELIKTSCGARILHDDCCGRATLNGRACTSLHSSLVPEYDDDNGQRGRQMMKCNPKMH
jgi:hypothetical protein